LNVRQATEEILECLFHPDFHDSRSKVQRDMLAYMHTWVQGLGSNQHNTLQRLNKQAVRNHDNVRRASEGGMPELQGSYAHNQGIHMQHNIQNYASSIPIVGQPQQFMGNFSGGPSRKMPSDPASPALAGQTPESPPPPSSGGGASFYPHGPVHSGSSSYNSPSGPPPSFLDASGGYAPPGGHPPPPSSGYPPPSGGYAPHYSSPPPSFPGYNPTVGYAGGYTPPLPGGPGPAPYGAPPGPPPGFAPPSGPPPGQGGYPPPGGYNQQYGGGRW